MNEGMNRPWWRNRSITWWQALIIFGLLLGPVLVLLLDRVL
jgi:hypothetical protein